jgi:hypothetical protein
MAVLNDSTAKTAANEKSPRGENNAADGPGRIPEKSCSGGRGQKLVAVNAGRDAPTAVMRPDPHDFRKTADVDVSGHGNFAGQGEDELDGRSRLEIGVYQKV